MELSTYYWHNFRNRFDRMTALEFFLGQSIAKKVAIIIVPVKKSLTKLHIYLRKLQLLSMRTLENQILLHKKRIMDSEIEER